jgi:hypothetical protein
MKDLFHSLGRLFGARTPAPQPPPDAATITQWIREIRAANLSYCGPPKLENLAEAGQLVRAAGVEGCWIEAGVALGGSAILLARMKPAATPLDLYDVYGMIPPPGNHDGEDAHRRYAEIRSGASAGLGGDTYYGYVDNLLERVKQNLRRFQVDPEGGTVRCVPGLFEHTLHPGGPVAFAHIDCDWYDSVRVCIERLEGHLVPGGIITFDDYSSYAGCRAAVDEWRARDRRIETVFERRSLGLRRKRS